MSKVQDQIANLTRHLYEQHQAGKEPVHVERATIEVDGPDGARITVSKPRSVPLAPGVHPMMGPRFLPGAVEVRQSVHSHGEAMDVVARALEPTSWKLEYSGVWPEPEDDVPSIDEPAAKKKYSRKLEP